MSSDSSSIEVQELVKMAKAEEEQWQKRSIYKLPASIKNIKPTAYTPQVVSLGPYHREDKNLKPMEIHKDRAVNHFLKRSGLTFGDCVRSLLGIEKELMDAYDWLDDDQYQDHKFLDLMVRDGIFMLEIIDDREKKVSGYAINDPVFSDHGNLYVKPLIKRDMLMLENQIPMKVLHELYRLQRQAKEVDAPKVIFQFLFPNKTTSTLPTNSLHILDMYRTGIIGPPPPYTTKKEGNIILSTDIIRSAVELDEAGIKIKKSKTSNLRDISFHNNGVLRLPMLIVDDKTEAQFLNLMAFERFHCGIGNNVTEYVFFMDNIIDDALDIKLLHARDIIQNKIGSDKAAAQLFNSLSKDICLDSKEDSLGHVYQSVNAYCKRRIPRYRAALYHTYLTSPWAIISVLAAVFLFALTISQTVYGILDFYKK